MLILALDSTALSASVALCEDEALVAEFTVNTGHTHSETLLPMVESVLRVTGRTVDEIDLFACTVGPGSFTGVRIGAATVKGIAFDIPTDNGKIILCPAMNARRAQVYNALFACEDGIVTRLCDDRALAITELLDELEAMGLPVYLMGDGAKLVYDAQGDQFTGKLYMLPERLIHQSGYNTAQCALRLWRDGVRTTDAELAPVYLRPSQAERTRAERLVAEGKK